VVSVRRSKEPGLASQQFDVLVTVDRNLSFQQNLTTFPIAVIVLRAYSNRLADLRPLVPALLAALQSPRAGSATVHSGSATAWTAAGLADSGEGQDGTTYGRAGTLSLVPREKRCDPTK